MEIRTDILIVLCHILDEFAEFRKDLRALVEKKSNNILSILNKIANNERVLRNKDAKAFYQKYQKVISVINNCPYATTTFLSLIVCHDDYYNLGFFYIYLLEHRTELNKILALLEKIKSLNITEINFMDSTFTDEIYKLKNFSYPGQLNVFYFMENMVAIPDSTEYIYKTTGTHYLMEIVPLEKHNLCFRITVNSLTFDPSLLPDDLSNENIGKKIVEALKINQQYRTDINEALKLSFPISELEKGCASLASNIPTLNNSIYKEDLLETLKELKLNLAKLKKIQDEYNQDIIKSNPLITSEIISKEQTLYLKKLNDID